MGRGDCEVGKPCSIREVIEMHSQDQLTREQRSALMAKIRGSGTRPEAAVAGLLRREKLRFTQHDAAIPGKPDFVLKRYRLVILVNGCFWHMHSCRRGQSAPASNAEFWRLKRTGNVLRDRRTSRKLRRIGWSVITIWECQTKDLEKLKRRLQKHLSNRRKNVS